MRFAKVLSVAALPMFLFACGDDNSSLKVSNPEGETPQDSSTVEPPPNIPDEELKPIARDYSLIWSGKGTAEEPFLIASEQDLASLAFYVNDSSMTFKDFYFKQTADIALSGAWSPIGIFGKNAYGYGNRPFSGVYDGGLKTITGLSITDTASYSGLFGLVRGAQVSNVVIKGAKLNVGSYAGVLAGKMDSTTVENCSFEDVEIKGADRVGGLVGEATHVQAKNVSVTGTIQGVNSVGGVVGRMQDGSLENVTNKANVSGTSTVAGVVGSFASVASEGVISAALNYGAVTGTKDVAGVVATLSATKLERSGNSGAVVADSSQMSNVGGVIAVASSKSAINEVFNTATVSVRRVMIAGGVIGALKNSSATNLFNLGEVSGTASNMGGLVGVVDGSDATLTFGYNAGKIPDNNFSGTVAGKVTSTATVTNVYYDKTVGGTCLVVASQMNMELPTGFTTDEMKAATFIATLNGTGSAWKAGSATFGGYPAFTWTE
ncbi:hypothetical protein Fisuc_2755 [Fibrobacter succinogenes subsp. succinogenes S85]|uniref:Lipoprotein n=2 Tax=Fibrobacter succinogenes (strain ATCC 19169 / S85) TaxID=59374 RepID=A0ABM5LL29_FIBSS|nr:hypothetical protein [Fibrobacter succinogenes]ACX76338.1 hypothetical protein Fisuc_2755 [Fibrobacter succinogenes subsp. succinogenes S85]